MESLRLSLLGPFQAEIRQRPITGFGYDKVRVLLAYLVVEAQIPHRRETLAALLWPEDSQKAARTSLRKALSTLRQALGDQDSETPFLLIDRDTVQINPASAYWLDVDVFQDSLAACESHPHYSDDECDVCIEELETAVKLYRGDFLQGLLPGDNIAMEEWILSRQEYFRSRVMSALHCLMRYYLKKGKYTQAQRYALRQVEMEPYREEAYQILMLSLVRSGQRSAAIAQYEACKRILADELGVEPSHETQSLYDRICQAGQSSPHNLPAVPLDLVGREGELLSIAEQLADPDCRLLTIVGPGGIGKTSLALTAAREHIGVFWDGVYLISLSALTQPEQVLTAIIGSLPISLDGPPDPLKQLTQFIEHKTILLVLDNMEHLLGASRLLADILAQAPYVKMVVTSRERLNLKSEWVFPLSGLLHPNDEISSQTNQIPGYGAVQLFVRRAQQVVRKFFPSTDQYLAVAEICNLLQGVPLGIELAAAWAGTHSLAEIKAKIQSSLDFLTTQMRDVHPRHASLRATFEHSWALLSPHEQDVLQRLSVFRSTFSLTAARKVASASQLIIDSLVEKSLLQRVSDSRFGLHSLIGQFVSEKLASHPEIETEIRANLIDYFSAFLEQKAKAYHQDKQRKYLDEIHLEIDNIRATWSLAVGLEKWEALDRAHEGLYDFFDAFGWYSEGRATFESTILALKQSQTISDQDRDRILGRMLARQARFTIHLGERDAAWEMLQESISLLPGLDDRALPLSYLGMMAHMKGDYPQAIAYAEESLAISRRIGGREGEAFCLNMLGNIALAQGQQERARTLHAENLAIRLEIGDHLGVAIARNNLANIAHARGAFAEAKQQYQESYRSFEILNHRLGMAATLSNAGYMASKLKDFAEAKKRYKEALLIKRELGNQQSVAITLMNLCELSVSQGDLENAEMYVREALELTNAVQAVPLILETLICYAEILTHQGQKSEAVEILSLIQSNPAVKHETKTRAEKMLSGIEKEIRPDSYSTAFEMGRLLELNTVISQLLQ